MWAMWHIQVGRPGALIRGKAPDWLLSAKLLIHIGELDSAMAHIVSEANWSVKLGLHPPA